LQDIERNGYKGIGKPEPLKHDLQGFWSVEIDEKSRIVFRIEDGKLEITQCGSHYQDR
jgi:toxin YoeB